MNENDKQLLLKDLCARLPYGVKCRENKKDSQICILFPEYLKSDVERFEPYLRPMSSMTEEEIIQYKCMNDALDENYEVHIDNAYPAFDFLNAHHFDYRGLIEKGLALEALADMYND